MFPKYCEILRLRLRNYKAVGTVP